MMVNEQNFFNKRRIHFSGSLIMGTGIWSMHFIGMLSYKMRMKMQYDPLITLGSWFFAVIVGYGVLRIIDRKKLSMRRISGGALVLGLAVCGMHYIGMAAMEMDAKLLYVFDTFILSVLIAVVVSGVALWIAFTHVNYNSQYTLYLRIGASLMMGLALCSMHYTGMAATVFIPYAQCRFDPNQDFEGLAWGIAAANITIFFALAKIIVSGLKEKMATYNDVYTFPVKLLTAAMVLTLGVMIWMGGNSLYIHYFLTHNIAKDQALAEVADQILYLDTIILESVRGESVTGDDEFDKK